MKTQCTNVEETLQSRGYFSKRAISQLLSAQSVKLAEALETEKRARAQLEQELQVRKKTTWVFPKQDPPRVSENLEDQRQDLEEALDDSEFALQQLEDLQNRLVARNARSDKLAEALEKETHAHAQLEKELHKRKKTTWVFPKPDSPHVSENLEEALDDSEFVVQQLGSFPSKISLTSQENKLTMQWLVA
jgi:DNA repair exonuclease SbcCD ATPase subunit